MQAESRLEWHVFCLIDKRHLGVTAWEAGASCVRGGKDKGKELMAVSAT